MTTERWGVCGPAPSEAYDAEEEEMRPANESDSCARRSSLRWILRSNPYEVLSVDMVAHWAGPL